MNVTETADDGGGECTYGLSPTSAWKSSPSDDSAKLGEWRSGASDDDTTSVKNKKIHVGVNILNYILCTFLKILIWFDSYYNNAKIESKWGKNRDDVNFLLMIAYSFL